MNWLAHVFLSENNIDFQIGNFLADPLKAKTWENSSLALEKGMRTHILIDSYSDKHKVFRRSKKRLKEKGLLKGIIIDFVYDYLLCKNFHLYSNISLENFIKEFYTKANLQKEFYPPLPKKIVRNMISKDLLNYSSFDLLKDAFTRLDKRISENLAKKDTASSYFEIVKEKIEDLEKDFLEFFPELILEITKNLEKKRLKHIKFKDESLK